MSADDYADLARLAEAATPGPWEHDGYAGIDSEESPSWIAHLTTYDPGEGSGNPRWRADAEFIAAANPATILRLIEQEREWHRVAASNEDARNEARIERDRLAARLAAVEALADELTEQGDHHVPGCRGQADCAKCVQHDLRAALSAAPTDTTKEN